MNWHDSFDLDVFMIKPELLLTIIQAYGHMGRTNRTVEKKFEQPNGKSKTMNVELFTWEKLDLVTEIKTAFKL